MSSLVSHPDHYNKEGSSECWDDMENYFSKDAVIIFDVLSAYKYLYRRGLKPGNSIEQENAKIQTYMDHAYMLLNSREEDKKYDFPSMLYGKMQLILEESEVE